MCSACGFLDSLDADDARAEREANQDSEFSALVEAERNGDEPYGDWSPDDEEYPSRA